MLSNHPNVLGGGAGISESGSPAVGGPASSTDKALARWNGTSGLLLQNGVVTEADYTGNLTGASDQATTSAAGSGFANQPSNDSITLVSDNAGDVQTATVIGTTTATNTVVTEAIALTGTTPAITVKANWGQILAIKLSSAAVGTITVTKTTGASTITTIAPAATSKGVTTVVNTAAFNRTLSTVASGATTKQIGWGGTNTSGTQIYDSIALNGATAVASNVAFLTLTEIYRGDLEATRTVTVTTNGGWTLTGGGGATLNLLTAGAASLLASGTNQSITLTPSGTGQVTIQNGNASNGLLLLTENSGGIGVETRIAGGVALLASATNAVLALGTNEAEKIRIAASGNLLLGGLTTDGTGVLQFPAATAPAGGITFGADWNLWRLSSSAFVASATGSNGNLYIQNSTTGAGAGDGLSLETNGATSATINWRENGPLLFNSNNTLALTLDSSQNATFAGTIISTTDTRTGAGAVSVTKLTTKYVTGGAADALTLANGADGQPKTIICDVITTGGDTGILTPTTKTGYTAITFSAAGQSAALQYVTTRGWMIISLRGAVAT